MSEYTSIAVARAVEIGLRKTAVTATTDVWPSREVAIMQSVISGKRAYLAALGEKLEGA